MAKYMIQASYTREGMQGVMKEGGSGRRDAIGKLLAEVGRRVKDEQGVALVGHDPQMSLLVAALGDVAKTDQERIDFRKGAIVRIDVGELPSARPTQPRWWMKPRSRTLAKGLPLKKPATAEKPTKARR